MPSCSARRASECRRRGRARRSPPIFRASSRRYGFTSVTTTWRAPGVLHDRGGHDADGAGAGDQHVFAEHVGNESAVWTALPNGSKIAATSRSMSGRWCQTLVIGSAMYSANAPGRLTPTPLVCVHRCRRPARQLRQRPQTTWPFAADDVAGLKVVHVGADCRRSRRRTRGRRPSARDGLLRPGVPFVDVQVGAADAGLGTRISTSLMPIEGSGPDQPDALRERLRPPPELPP